MTQPRSPRWLEFRKRYLPVQIEAARHKLAMLETEARRYGLNHLINQGE